MGRGRYLWITLFACLLVACSGEEEYHYPSVKQEFLTAYSNTEGVLKTVLTDNGVALQVVEDATDTQIDANSSVRIVCNYEQVDGDNGVDGIKLYALLKALASLPVSEDKFEGVIKTDPVELLSAWMGLDYLNVILTVKAQNGKHEFGFIENQVIENEDGNKDVYLTLYHDAKEDLQAYTKRAYLSVPLEKYLSPGKTITVHFSLYSYSGEWMTYCFDYNS